ncbi:unnamed protein product [Dicrocoelium dendriticum]|nr:unnamed protein product [Dicrocoelium dendriticum]
MTNYFVPNMELHISPFVVPFRETVIESSPAPTHSLATNTSESIEKVRSRLESILLGSDDPVAIVTEPLAPITEAVCFTCGPNDTPLDLYPPTSSGCKIYIQKESMHDAFAPSIDPTNLPVGHFQLPHSKTRTRVIIRVSVHPLPEKLLQWVETRGARKVSQLIRAFKIQAAVYDSLVAAFNTEFSQLCSSLVQTEANRPSGSSIDWCNMAPRFLALGPGQTGPNMFFSRLKTDHLPIFTAWGQQVYAYENGPPRPPPCNRPNLSLPLVSYGKALLRGFQLATERGPLCGEPMRGVLFILEEIYAEERCRFGILDLLSQQQQQQQIASNAFAELPMEPSLPPAIDALEQMVENGRFSRMHLLNWLNENKKGEMIHFEDDDWTSVLDNGELLHSLSTEPSISEADLGGLNEKQNTVQTLMNGIPYWKRLTDEAWVQDVSPGLLTSAVSRACIAAFQASPGQRLMLCMYDVELQARPDVLGRMFGVLRKRHGRVVSEDLRDGENIFTIKARLPVIESFGLAVELRSRTSGVVSLPQLRPDGWEVLDVDPIPRNPDHTLTDKSVASHDVVVPRKGRKSTVDRPTAPASAAKVVTDSDEDTVDELTSHFARVRKYIRDVRIRKGLSTNEQLVLHPDKQRTLKRNK